MRRYFVSLMATVVIVALAVIAWTPSAKGQDMLLENCIDICKANAVCQCVKILGGTVRLTVCNIQAQCEPDMYAWSSTGASCNCSIVDPVCKPFIERDLVVQAFPPTPLDCVLPTFLAQ